MFRTEPTILPNDPINNANASFIPVSALKPGIAKAATMNRPSPAMEAANPLFWNQAFCMLPSVVSAGTNGNPQCTQRIILNATILWDMYRIFNTESDLSGDLNDLTNQIFGRGAKFTSGGKPVSEIAQRELSALIDCFGPDYMVNAYVCGLVPIRARDDVHLGRRPQVISPLLLGIEYEYDQDYEQRFTVKRGNQIVGDIFILVVYPPLPNGLPNSPFMKTISAMKLKIRANLCYETASTHNASPPIWMAHNTESDRIELERYKLSVMEEVAAAKAQALQPGLVSASQQALSQGVLPNALSEATARAVQQQQPIQPPQTIIASEMVKESDRVIRDQWATTAKTFRVFGPQMSGMSFTDQMRVRNSLQMLSTYGEEIDPVFVHEYGKQMVSGMLNEVDTPFTSRFNVDLGRVVVNVKPTFVRQPAEFVQPPEHLPFLHEQVAKASARSLGLPYHHKGSTGGSGGGGGGGGEGRSIQTTVGNELVRDATDQSISLWANRFTRHFNMILRAVYTDFAENMFGFRDLIRAGIPEQWLETMVYNWALQKEREMDLEETLNEIEEADPGSDAGDSDIDNIENTDVSNGTIIISGPGSNDIETSKKGNQKKHSRRRHRHRSKQHPNKPKESLNADAELNADLTEPSVLTPEVQEWVDHVLHILRRLASEVQHESASKTVDELETADPTDASYVCKLGWTEYFEQREEQRKRMAEMSEMAQMNTLRAADEYDTNTSTTKKKSTTTPKNASNKATKTGSTPNKTTKVADPASESRRKKAPSKKRTRSKEVDEEEQEEKEDEEEEADDKDKNTQGGNKSKK